MMFTSQPYRYSVYILADDRINNFKSFAPRREDRSQVVYDGPTDYRRKQALNGIELEI